MKTAVSIPDDVFTQAEQLARRLNKSRSELYSHALREYVAKHSPDYVTEALDALAEDTEPDSTFAAEAARRTLDRSEW